MPYTLLHLNHRIKEGQNIHFLKNIAPKRKRIEYFYSKSTLFFLLPLLKIHFTKRLQINKHRTYNCFSFVRLFIFIFSLLFSAVDCCLHFRRIKLYFFLLMIFLLNIYVSILVKLAERYGKSWNTFSPPLDSSA